MQRCTRPTRGSRRPRRVAILRLSGMSGWRARGLRECTAIWTQGAAISGPLRPNRPCSFLVLKPKVTTARLGLPGVWIKEIALRNAAGLALAVDRERDGSEADHGEHVFAGGEP